MLTGSITRIFYIGNSAWSFYSDKLAHVQVVINCQYSVAQMCTCEDIHVRLFMGLMWGHESEWAHNNKFTANWTCAVFWSPLYSICKFFLSMQNEKLGFNVFLQVLICNLFRARWFGQAQKGCTSRVECTTQIYGVLHTLWIPNRQGSIIRKVK